MDYAQILSKAKSECNYLTDDNCTRIFIAALKDNTSAPGVYDSLSSTLEGYDKPYEIIKAGSYGFYNLEPMVTVERPGSSPVTYSKVTPDTAVKIVEGHIRAGSPPPDMAIWAGGDEYNGIPNSSGLPLFSLQNRVALRNCGRIDPGNIDHYILRGGFSGLSRILSSDSETALQVLEQTGLRDNAYGYHVFDRCKAFHDLDAGEKYLVCYAADAIPGARTAGLLMGSDPYSFLEGLLTGAFVVGATHCIICVGDLPSQDTPLFMQAMEQMREYSLLGEDILGSGFSMELEVKEIPVSLVSGEETALLLSLEDKQAMPNLRTDPQAFGAYNSSSALVAGIETLSIIPTIFQNEAGNTPVTDTGKGRGTRVFTLKGDITRKYTIEVPPETTLRSIIMDIGDGVPGGKNIKAVQPGGPGGSFLPGDSPDMPVDYQTITPADGIVGSGMIEVFDEDRCGVSVSIDTMAYLEAESCGKCVFCREGTFQIHDILEDIETGRSKAEDLELMAELAEAMKAGSICSLGPAAADVILSSMRVFSDDYDMHIKQKKCPVADKD